MTTKFITVQETKQICIRVLSFFSFCTSDITLDRTVMYSPSVLVPDVGPPAINNTPIHTVGDKEHYQPPRRISKQNTRAHIVDRSDSTNNQIKKKMVR